MLVYQYITIFVTYCIIAELIQNNQESVRTSWILLAIACMLCSAHAGSCMRLVIGVVYLLIGINLAYTYGG